LRAGDPAQRADLVLDPGSQLVGQCLGRAVAQLLQLAVRPADRGRLAFQDRGERAGEGFGIAASGTSHPGQVTLGPAQPVTGMTQRQDPVQGGDRPPDAQPAQVGAEIAHLASRLRLVGDGKARVHRPGVHPDVDGAFLAARRPVPRRQRCPQQVALQPGGFVDRGTADSLDPGNPRHHRGQVTAIAQIRPVRRHPAAQRAGPAGIQHPVTRIPEPVAAGQARQACHLGRRVAPHQGAPPASCTHATWQLSARPAAPVQPRQLQRQVAQRTGSGPLDTSNLLTMRVRPHRG
jgi:hypothetical protein